MPVFDSTTMMHLRALEARQTHMFSKLTAQNLIDKSLAWPVQRVKSTIEVEISDYGRRVIAFYDAIKAGKVKTTLNQCGGCPNQSTCFD